MPTPQALTHRIDDPGDSGVDRRSLAGLCYYAAGITKTISRRGHEHQFRAAACTGALYHIDLYPVCGDLGDLDAGVYHYDPRSDALDVLRVGDYRGVLAEASREPAVEQAPVTFVATSTWWRNAWKYRARTYRHAFWDSGTILANLLAVATALDHSSRVVVAFADDPVANLLGIDPEWEAPLELVPIGGGDPAPPTPAPVEAIDPATVPLESDPREHSLIHAAWRASTLPDGETAREWRRRGERPVTGRGPGEGSRVELDSVDPGTVSDRPIHETIRRRGSARAYERDNLSLRTVSTVLDLAIRCLPLDVREYRASANGVPALQFVDCYCIVNGVDDIEPGAYQYHPGPGDLELLRPGDYREEAGYLALGQQLGADAAVCVYFLCDLDAVTDVFGDRGYRAAQLEAALTAGRLYLATYALEGVGGTGLTFFDDAVTEFFEPRAAGQTPMFLYTMGRPSEVRTAE